MSHRASRSSSAPAAGRLALRVLLLAASAPLALAQSVTVINYDALPACAKQCQKLTTAQAGCVPPAAQVTTQQTYVSCFCQSAFLATLYTTSVGVCDAECPNTADQTTIQQWYINYCRNGVGGPSSSPASSSSPVPSTSASAGTSNGATSSSSNSINDMDGDGDPSNNYSGSWISSHWRWVVMLAVIFFAMIFFSILGVWLKRRHRARRDALGANLAAHETRINPVPAPPPMAHMKHADDSGTLASTADLSMSGANGGGGTAAGTPKRPRSRTNTLTRFPNGSMSNVAPPVPTPVVWGPHQHQAATRGYEYHNHTPMSGSPGPSVPSTPVGIPTPSMTPVGGGGGYNRYSGGTNRNRSNEVINEALDEDRIETARGGAGTPGNGSGKKLSKR